MNLEQQAGAQADPGLGPADPDDVAGYPFLHTVTSRFADLDPLGHINNVAIAEFYEDARVEFMRAAIGRDAASPNDPFSMVLAELTVRYLAEAPHPGTYQVGLGVTRLGRTSIVQLAGLFRGGVRIGASRSVLVHVVDHQPAPLTDWMRAGLQARSFRALRAGSA
jgi:acyl-CoA thioester hydrolase